jgi:hypothetical protein
VVLHLRQFSRLALFANNTRSAYEWSQRYFKRRSDKPTPRNADRQATVDDLQVIKGWQRRNSGALVVEANSTELVMS